MRSRCKKSSVHINAANEGVRSGSQFVYLKGGDDDNGETYSDDSTGSGSDSTGSVAVLNCTAGTELSSRPFPSGASSASSSAESTASASAGAALIASLHRDVCSSGGGESPAGVPSVTETLAVPPGKNTRPSKTI